MWSRINSTSSSPKDSQPEDRSFRNYTHKRAQSQRVWGNPHLYYCAGHAERSLGSLNSCHVVSNAVCNTKSQQRWRHFSLITEVRTPGFGSFCSWALVPKAQITKCKLDSNPPAATSVVSSVLDWKVEISQDSGKYRLQCKNVAALKRYAGKRELVSCLPSPHG